MKLRAGTCGLSEWQILSKKWHVPSTTINWTNENIPYYMQRCVGYQSDTGVTISNHYINFY